ncbi:protein inturned isoform X1 [Athalia rosae]|uniref:protein inturned isoform X1 n=1 Tax=Athalia rosae TaxID=37344 RepID=UPI002033F775|nr:protein inturned isoform X1 [Athalia rosae]
MSKAEAETLLNQLERPVFTLANEQQQYRQGQQVVVNMNIEDGKVENNDNDEDNGKENEDEDDWWESDSESSTGSYYSDNSSIVEWDSAIEWTGEVFYIESFPAAPGSFQTHCPRRILESKTPSPELTRRRSTRAGKFMRLIRRRDSRRYSLRNKARMERTSSPNNEKPAHKSVSGHGGGKEVTFRDTEVSEIRQVVVRIDPGKRHKLGRRASLCEAYIGIVPGSFSDNIRVMVAGFVPGGDAMKNKIAKIGDWLRSIDGKEVSVQNLESLLSEILEPMDVNLELQRVAGTEVGKTPLEPISVKQQSSMAYRLVSEEYSRSLLESLMKFSVGIIFLRTTGLSETGPELQDVIYSFPRSPNKCMQSVLCRTRGAFVTLDHMLSSLLGPRPISTTTLYDNELINVSYIPEEEELLLLALPEKNCCLQKTLEISEDVVRALELSYQSLSKCFSAKDNHLALDHFFALLFWRIIIDPSEAASDLKKPRSDVSMRILSSNFNDTLPAARCIQLPRDAQIQIDAALNEMEAMDYRNWNEDPMNCQRLYTILGSSLYHRDFLLASHLPSQDLIEIHSFLRQKGLLSLVKEEAVKSLVVWKEVYPLSCNRGCFKTVADGQPFVPNGKWFLLVVGFGHQLLTVLLESGGCTAELEENARPDVFYVEEAQETLKHVQKIGIPTLAEKWLGANTRPEMKTIRDRSLNKFIPSIAENLLLGLVKSGEPRSIVQKISPIDPKKSQEVSSILKRRTLDRSTASTGSVNSLQTSEDSMSQGTGAVSEASDEAAPILGRRATRERVNNSNLHQSDGSDSEMDYDRIESQLSTMDIADIRRNLLNQAAYIVPKKVSAVNEEVLLHYVYFDTLEGILISSNFDIGGNSKESSQILHLFNSSANIIHRLLKKTVRFEKMLNQDTGKSVINKSLIAIKEHGVLFEVNGCSYWVVGRSYATPQPRELYVCYNDDVPQSLIEMAFRLNTT